MLGYPYIQQLFYTVLSNSKVIRGNFFVCPKWGSEIGNPNIDEAIPIGAAVASKYPAVLLMPPPKQGYFQFQGTPHSSGTNMYDVYMIQMLFLAGSITTGKNQPMQPTPAQVSSHTVADTWHDMDRCAQNFLTVLQGTVNKLGGTVIISDQADSVPRIRPVTNLGGDSASGVSLTFKLLIFSGCVVEDYPTGWQDSIVAPTLTDAHPLHSM